MVKTHPRQPPGGRSTDRDDLPAEKAGYALRDLTRLVAVCAGHGPNIGIYAERLLDDPLPWTRMRAVYRLLGLVRRYGPGPVEAACGRSLDLDVCQRVQDRRDARQRHRTAPAGPARRGRLADHDPQGGRFARDPGEYTPARPVQLTLIPGGVTDQGDPR